MDNSTTCNPDKCLSCGTTLFAWRYLIKDGSGEGAKIYQCLCDKCYFEKFSKDVEEARKIEMICFKCGSILRFEETKYNKYKVYSCEECSRKSSTECACV